MTDVDTHRVPEWRRRTSSSFGPLSLDRPNGVRTPALCPQMTRSWRYSPPRDDQALIPLGDPDPTVQPPTHDGQRGDGYHLLTHPSATRPKGIPTVTIDLTTGRPLTTADAPRHRGWLRTPPSPRPPARRPRVRRPRGCRGTSPSTSGPPPSPYPAHAARGLADRPRGAPRPACGSRRRAPGTTPARWPQRGSTTSCCSRPPR